MKGRIDSGLGQIIIDTDVIATYAGSVAVECFWYYRYGRCQHEGRPCKAAQERFLTAWYKC